jgi:hypothetical protein
VGVSDIVLRHSNKEFVRTYLGQAERLTKEATYLDKDSSAFLDQYGILASKYYYSDALEPIMKEESSH